MKNEVFKAKRKLEKEKKEVNKENLARKMGLSLDEYLELEQDWSISVKNINEAFTGYDGSKTFAEVYSNHSPTLEDETLLMEDKRILYQALKTIKNEKKRKAVELYFLEGENQEVIGEILGVTASRICQIHTEILPQLKETIIEIRSEGI